MTSHDLPIGGSTGCDHAACGSASIDQAVQFLAITEPRDRPKPLVPALREMFGLSALEACQAIHQSHEIGRATA